MRKVAHHQKFRKMVKRRRKKKGAILCQSSSLVSSLLSASALLHFSSYLSSVILKGSITTKTKNFHLIQHFRDKVIYILEVFEIMKDSFSDSVASCIEYVSPSCPARPVIGSSAPIWSLGSLRLVRELGAGFHSRVFLAGGGVAVKVATGVNSHAAKEGIKNEIVILMKLSPHLNIIKVNLF